MREFADAVTRRSFPLLAQLCELEKFLRRHVGELHLDLLKFSRSNCLSVSVFPVSHVMLCSAAVDMSFE